MAIHLLPYGISFVGVVWSPSVPDQEHGAFRTGYVMRTRLQWLLLTHLRTGEVVAYAISSVDDKLLTLMPLADADAPTPDILNNTQSRGNTELRTDDLASTFDYDLRRRRFAKQF